MIYITAQKEAKRCTEDAYTGHGPLPIGALLFMASATHGFFKSVNLIDHVSLEDRLRIQGYDVGCGVGEYELHWRWIRQIGIIV
jgi:hypothetical protein